MEIHEPQVGDVYVHFKNSDHKYTIVAIARDSETLEEMVVYQGHYTHEEFGTDPVFVRPKDMFTEIITRDGKTFPRFQFVENAKAA